MMKLFSLNEVSEILRHEYHTIYKATLRGIVKCPQVGKHFVYRQKDIDVFRAYLNRKGDRGVSKK